jgi:CBS domain-containing protein
MQIRDVMTKSVEAVAPDTPLRDAARKMRAHGISLLPVCEGPAIIGLLTSRDITVRATGQGCDPQHAQVRDVMMTPAICGHEDQNVAEAAGVMRRWRLSRLPVLNRYQRLVGIVSLKDVSGDARTVARRRSSCSDTKSGRRTGRGLPPTI